MFRFPFALAVPLANSMKNRFSYLRLFRRSKIGSISMTENSTNAVPKSYLAGRANVAISSGTSARS